MPLLLLSRCSRAQLCATPEMAAHQAPPPWDSPGKNTGGGCHFLLQCVKVKNEREVTGSCLTLSDPTDCSPPGSSVRGIFQARVLKWGAIAFSHMATGASKSLLAVSGLSRCGTVTKLPAPAPVTKLPAPAPMPTELSGALS